MYEIGYSGKFKKDLSTIKKRSVDNFEELREFIKELQKTGYQGVKPKHKPHKLERLGIGLK